MTAKPGKRAELVALIQRSIDLAAEHEPGVALACLHISPEEWDDQTGRLAARTRRVR